jgi:hypothetical protein
VSYLSLPRIHFSGFMSVNTATGNNDGVQMNKQFVSNPASVTVDTKGLTPEKFIEWMKATITDSGSHYYKYPHATWNYFGDNGVTFEQTTVTGVELQRGSRLINPKDDPLIGAAINLLGSQYYDRRFKAVMVDVDPFDAFSTQIYSAVFQLQKGDDILLKGNSPTRAFSWWVNLWKNLQAFYDFGSSAVWQLGLPKDGLNFSNRAISHSPALAALHDAAMSGQGLLVRLCTYMLGQGIPPEQVDPMQPNPRNLVMVGTIGCWENGEVSAVPMGRLLYPDPNTPLTIPSEIETQKPDPARRYWLAPAIARVDRSRKVVSLDLINTIPEASYVDITNRPPTDATEKIDLGTLCLCLRYSQGGSETIAPIGQIPFTSYNKAAYFARSGIVDLPYPEALEPYLDAGDLVLFQGETPHQESVTLLTEMPLNVVPEEDYRGIWLNVDDLIVIKLRVLEKGQPPQTPLTLTPEQIPDPEIPPGAANLAKRKVSARISLGSHMGTVPYRRLREVDASTNVLELPETITVGKDGTATFTMKALNPGLCKVLLKTDDDPAINLPEDDPYLAYLQWLLFFYINVRVLPKDDFSDKSDDFLLSDEGYQFMYDNVFKYFDLLFPVMSRVINWRNKDEVINNVTLLKVFTSDEGIESTVYMPITRDLSAGKRELIRRWCSLNE